MEIRYFIVTTNRTYTNDAQTDIEIKISHSSKKGREVLRENLQSLSAFIHFPLAIHFARPVLTTNHGWQSFMKEQRYAAGTNGNGSRFRISDTRLRWTEPEPLLELLENAVRFQNWTRFARLPLRNPRETRCWSLTVSLLCAGHRTFIPIAIPIDCSNRTLPCVIASCGCYNYRYVSDTAWPYKSWEKQSRSS